MVVIVAINFSIAKKNYGQLTHHLFDLKKLIWEICFVDFGLSKSPKNQRCELKKLIFFLIFGLSRTNINVLSWFC